MISESRIRRSTPAAVFLEGSADGPDLPPLSPFLRHHALRAGLSEKDLRNPQQCARFGLWCVDTYHRERAPYQWTLPQRFLAWLNTPAEPQPGVRLTLFLAHVWQHYRQDLDLRRPEERLQFFAWFAFECVPAWNLPRGLLPESVLSALNEPYADGSLPLTAGLAAHAEALRGGALPEEPPALVAASFAAVADALAAGDPRLLPEFVSRFWSSPAEPDSKLTAFEYTAARAWAPDGDVNWLAGHCPPAFSSPAALGGALSRGSRAGSVEIEPPARTVFSYRDHHSVSGLARAGANAVAALQNAAAPVVDLDFAFDRRRMGEEFAHNERQLTHTAAGIHIFNVNPEYLPECMLTHLQRMGERDRVIGQFYWELSDIGPVHECGLSLVDEIWVASEFLREVYSRRVSVPVLAMGQAVEPMTPDARYTRASFGIPEDAYAFLVSFDGGSVVERKNPLGAVAAFRQAFPKSSERVSLVVKAMNMGGLQTAKDREHWGAVLAAARGDPRIRILDHTFGAGEMAALSEACDSYVSLHRSEGFGYGPAEAMARGKPVIATAYSGVTDFCTAETSFPVPFRLIPVPPNSYPYMAPDRTYEWAEPDTAAAAERMRTLYRTPQTGRLLGERGRVLMAERYSLRRLAERYRARLGELGAL